MKQGTELTAQRAVEFNIPPQEKGEGEIVFKERVSGALRDMGHIIEAHEAHNNQLFDENGETGGPMTGIVGAVAQAMMGVDYGSRGSRQVGDDLAVGVIVKNPRRDMSPETALLAIFMDEAGRRK